jgi:hypothetical protein
MLRNTHAAIVNSRSCLSSLPHDRFDGTQRLTWYNLSMERMPMIRDRDRIHSTVVTRRLRAMVIRDKPDAPASPWQNGFAERLIGSTRRKCLYHVIVLAKHICAEF